MAGSGFLLGAVLTAALVVPAAGLWRSARRRPADRCWRRLLALGVAADLLAGLLRLAPGVSALTWLVDLLTLVGPVLLGAAVTVALRQRLAGLRLNVVLDGLTGAFAAAAVAALVMAPLAAGVYDGSWASLVVLGRPLLDAALLAAAVAATGLLGTAHSGRPGLWAAGFAALAAADTARAAGLGEPGAAVASAAGAVLLGHALLALGAMLPATHADGPVPGPASLTVPSLASLAAVSVLTVAPDWQVSPAPSALALTTLAVCALRFVRVFVQLRDLAEVRQQALTDVLTGLANRRALYLYLDALLDPAGAAAAEAAGVAVPEHGPELTVALVDLDHFKEVNDTLGHAVGDAMLRGVTDRFTAALEGLRTPYLFARLGGDEFAIVLHEATSRDAALVVGQALLDSLATPLDLEGVVVHAQASVGLAAAPRHGRTRREILFAADAAMYAAKSSGDGVRFHAPHHDEKTAQLELSEELHTALERREIVVDYQPICTPAGTLVAAEALVRWEHPERGRLLPADFLGAAERYRLSGALTRRVLEVALGDLARWRAYGVPLGVSVNVSAADLRDDTVVATVAEVLLEHQVPAEALTLDVPATHLAAADLDRTGQVLHAVRELGVRLALDDYGSTGLGLAPLPDLPFDDVKLDRRFVRDVAVSERGTAVVRATLDLVHALGMRLVAEGVEDRRALARLTELGCDLVQGHQVARPTGAADIERGLARPRGGKHRLLPEQPPAGQPRLRGPGALPARGALRSPGQ